MSILNALNTSFSFYPNTFIYLYTRDAKLYSLQFINKLILYQNNDDSSDSGILSGENINKWDIVFIQRDFVTLFGSYLNVPNIN